MTYGRGGEPPSTKEGSVEASSHATVISVRPSFAYNDQQLAPFVEGGASGSRDGRAEGGGVHIENQNVSVDHDHDKHAEGGVAKQGGVSLGIGTKTGRFALSNLEKPRT